MNTTQLKAEYATLEAQLVVVNTHITDIMANPKRYTYSNIESTHSAESHSLAELTALKASILSQMTAIENQLKGCFVKLK